MTKIVAIKLEVEDSATGAVSDFHVLDNYAVYKSANYIRATFATYVNQTKYTQGRSPVSTSIEFSLDQLPEDDVNIEQWIYQKAAESADESAENPSPLAGGTLVYEA